MSLIFDIPINKIKFYYIQIVISFFSDRLMLTIETKNNVFDDAPKNIEDFCLLYR